MKMAKTTKSKAKVGSTEQFVLKLTPKAGLALLGLALVIGVAGLLGYNKVKYGTFTAQAAWAPTIICGNNRSTVSTYISGSTASELRLQKYSGGWVLVRSVRLSGGGALLSHNAAGTYNYRGQAKYGTTYANTGALSC